MFSPEFSQIDFTTLQAGLPSIRYDSRVNRQRGEKIMNQNKKIFCAALVLLLCACNAQKQESIHESEPEETIETAEESTFPEEVQENHVIWFKEPSMKLEGTDDLASFPFILGASVEYSGYPIAWHLANPDEREGIPEYREDVLAVKKDGYFGIMDFDGNVIYPFIAANVFEEDRDQSPVRYQPYTGYIMWKDYVGAEVFDKDFKTTSFAMAGGLGGYAPQPYVLDGKLLIEDVQTNQTGPFTNTYGLNIAVNVNDADRNPTGCAVVSKDSEILFETEGYCSGIVNGFLKVSENSDWMNPGKTGFARVKDGEKITEGTVYEETGVFSDGFAPVKKNGLWTFIDEDGNLLGDPLFTHVSGVNHGRAYVEYEGLYGILDVKTTAEKGIKMTRQTLAGDYQEEELVIPDIAPEKPIGKVTVNVDNLNTRSIPSTSGEKKEKVALGETYDVYEIFENEGYTWYRIDQDRWAADSSGWLSWQGN